MSTVVHNQWRSRPEDQRFTSLPAMANAAIDYRRNAAEKTVSSAKVRAVPAGREVALVGEKGNPCSFTHWSFGQLAASIKAPADYLRSGLPAEIAADCINYGLQFGLGHARDFGMLLHRGDDQLSLDAWTGPRYGRIWNDEVIGALMDRFGDGVTGRWRVPGEFGHDVAVDKSNTTLYASDRDMFVFLADEKNRITVPNRRNGEPGSLARGFYLWNSQVGAKTIGFGAFLFDFVCSNRILWGVEEFAQISIRHTVSAPDRWLDEIVPVLTEFADGSARGIGDTIAAAQEKKLRGDLNEFLAKRFGKKFGERMQVMHQNEEDRPIETVWDVVTAATAVAREIPNNDRRVMIEEIAGNLLQKVA